MTYLTAYDLIPLFLITGFMFIVMIGLMYRAFKSDEKHREYFSFMQATKDRLNEMPSRQSVDYKLGELEESLIDYVGISFWTVMETKIKYLEKEVGIANVAHIALRATMEEMKDIINKYTAGAAEKMKVMQSGIEGLRKADKKLDARLDKIEENQIWTVSDATEPTILSPKVEVHRGFMEVGLSQDETVKEKIKGWIDDGTEELPKKTKKKPGRPKKEVK